MNLRKSLQYYLALNSYVERIQSAGLPSSYERLEYLESSGAQYIDLGRVPNNNDIIEQKFQKKGTSTETCSWYGSMPSAQTILPRMGIGSFKASVAASGSIFAGTNYTGYTGPIGEPMDTNPHVLRFQSTGQTELTYTYDGVTYVIDASTATTLPDFYEPAVELTSYLFARHGSNGVQTYDNEGTRIYYHREYLANGTLVMSLIPVKRKSDNVLGMYDTISGSFLTNSGTGTFTAGPSTTDFKDAIHNGLKEITAYGKAIQPAKDYLDTVIANGGTELAPVDYIDLATAKGGTALRKVSKEYEELEYVTFDGTQVIDTGVICNEESRIESKWIANTSSIWVYGTGNTNPRITCYCVSSGNQRFGNVTVDSTGITNNVLNTVIQDKNGFYYNGTNGKSYSNVGTFTCLNTLTIGNSNGSTGTPYFNGNFYYMKIYQNSKLALNLVPAKRKFDNAIGFYDTVSNSFITPSTGILAAGPIVSIPDSYTQLEYLTGDGNAYIDLGISLTQDDEFELDFIMPSSSISMQNIFGYRNSASSNAMTAMIASTNNSFVTDFNNSDYSPYRLLTSVSAAAAYKVITNKNSRILYQGDTLVDSNTTICGDTITTGNVLVFNIGGSPAYTNKFTGSISRVIVKNRINLIPAKRNSDNVVGMYDIINNQFYTNAAETGAFIAGPVKSDANPNNPYDIYCNNGKLIKTANEANYIAGNITIGYWLRNSDGQPEASAPNFYTNMMPVKPDTSYVCFGRNKLNNTLSQYNRIAWYDSTGTWISNCTYTQNTVTVATSPANAAYARFHCNATTSNITQEIIDGYNWTFCEGTEEVAYTPYITTSTQEILQDASGNMATVQNLLQLDSAYQDTQEILTGVVTGKIGMLIVDGINEGRKIGTAWNATYKRGSFAVTGMLSTGYAVIDALCGHFKYATDVYGSPTTPGFCTNNGTIFFSFAGMDNITSAAEANAWFEAQYRAGTPVIVLYPLATTTSTTVDSQVLKTEPVYVIQGGLDNLAVDIVSSTKTVPSPNYPLDIRCNNGDLKTTTNIVEFNETRINSNTWASADKSHGFEVYADVYTKAVGNPLFSNANCFGVFVPCKKDQSISINFFDYTPDYSRCYCCEVTADGKVNTTPVHYGDAGELLQQTFTLTKNDSIGFVIEWYITSAQTRNYNASNYMVVYGSTIPTTYVPYEDKKFVELGVVVDPIAIETLVDYDGTINLFNKDTNPYINAYVHATTGVLTQGTEQYCFCIPCKPNTIYFLYGMSSPSAWGSFTSKAIGTTATTFVKGNNTLTTGPNDQYLIGLAYSGTTYDYRDTLKVVEYTDTMNVATCEALFGIDTYKDTQEILTGAITRNVGVKVLDGTETWTVHTSGAMSTLVMPHAKISSISCLCTHFEGVPNSTTIATMPIGQFKQATSTEETLFKTEYDNTDDWKAWLADQYAKGTPVIVVYPLTTATTETVSGQTLITPPVSIKQASMSGLTVDTTQTNVTVPTPTRPLDIYCNNGKLGPATFPGGYTQVEYLESSGTQYIDLGIKGNGNTKIEVEWMWYEESDVSTSGRVIGGRYTDSPYDAWAIGTNTGKTIVTSNNTIFLQYYGSAAVDPSLVKNTIVVPIGNWTHIVRSKDECIVNGTDYGSSTAHTFETPYNLHLFAFAQSTSSSSTPTIGCGIGRCKYLKIWNGDILVLDLVPAVSSNGTLGMYNKVNGDFLTNSGSGTFTAGPTIIDATGTPETITIYSKNLFNQQWTENAAISSTGQEVASAGWSRTDYIKVIPGETYTWTSDFTSSSLDRYYFYYSDTNTSSFKSYYHPTPYTAKYYTITIPSDVNYIRLQEQAVGSTLAGITNQLEEDYRPTVYEEYGSQTLSVQDLLSVSGYKDTQELINGIVTKKVGIKILDGTEENWNVGSGTGSVSAYLSGATSSWGVDNTVRGMCTHFNCKITGETTGAGDYRFANDLNIYNLPAALNISTKEEFIAWLAAQYAAGTPVTIVYLLATPTTETVDAQYCGLTAGNSNAEITGSIDGLTAEVCYKKLK